MASRAASKSGPAFPQTTALTPSGVRLNVTMPAGVPTRSSDQPSAGSSSGSAGSPSIIISFNGNPARATSVAHDKFDSARSGTIRSTPIA
ncbi:MAG: hypothetical protein U0746_06240 [Gemmataceae bacterium]